MDWLLYVLAVIGVVLLCVFVAIYIKFIRPMRQVLKTTKEITGMDLNELENSPLIDLSDEIPQRELYIEALEDIDIEMSDSVRKRVQEFEENQFQLIGCFAGIPSFEVAEVLIHPEGMFALVGQTKDEKNTRSRIVGFCDDETTISVCDNDLPTYLPLQKGEKKIERISESVEHVLNDFNSLKKDKTLLKITESNFIEELTKVENRRCMYIASNPDYVDAALIELNSDGGFFEHTIRQSLSDLISECCRDAYLSQMSVSASEWEKMRDQLIIVHDRSIKSSVIDEGADASIESVDFSKMYAESFKTINRDEYRDHIQQLPELSRPRLIGNIVDPVEADFYLGHV